MYTSKFLNLRVLSPDGSVSVLRDLSLRSENFFSILFNDKHPARGWRLTANNEARDKPEKLRRAGTVIFVLRSRRVATNYVVCWRSLGEAMCNSSVFKKLFSRHCVLYIQCCKLSREPVSNAYTLCYKLPVNLWVMSICYVKPSTWISVCCVRTCRDIVYEIELI